MIRFVYSKKRRSRFALDVSFFSFLSFFLNCTYQTINLNTMIDLRLFPRYPSCWLFGRIDLTTSVLDIYIISTILNSSFFLSLFLNDLIHLSIDSSHSILIKKRFIVHVPW